MIIMIGKIYKNKLTGTKIKVTDINNREIDYEYILDIHKKHYCNASYFEQNFMEAWE
jgi:hypothetical protein